MPAANDIPHTHVHHDFTELNPRIRSQPDPILDSLRARCPVAHDPAAGAWLLTRFADAEALLADDTLSRDPSKARPGSHLTELWREKAPLPDEPRGNLTGFFFLDDPDHGRLRRIIVTPFIERAAAVRRVVDAIIGALLDNLDSKGEGDVVADYATPLPVTVIAKILGVGVEHHAMFRVWSDSMGLSFLPNPTPEQVAQRWASVGAVEALFHELLAARRKAPGSDLISDLLQAQREGAPISDEEIVDNCGMLLLTGNTTTTDLITAGIYLMLTHPGEVALLRANPRRISAIVEETLRLASIASLTGRIATRPLSIGGIGIPAGAHVVASLLAANHDPAVFDDPHRFDPSRPKTENLAFGAGKRGCIGARLAVAEARQAIAAILGRFPDLKLDEPEVTLRALPGFRSIARLRVRTR